MLPLLAALLLSCGRERDDLQERGGRGAPPPSISLLPDVDVPGTWIPVFPGEVREEETIYWQLCGGGTPPRMLERRRLLLPLEPAEVPRGVLIVRAVVARTGYVARVQLLKVLSLPSHLSWDEPVAEALRGFRFQPATHMGRPVPVYYNLTLLPESAFADPRPRRARAIPGEKALPD